MAISKLEIQKQILKEANARANKLVGEILKQANRSGVAVDPSSMDAINSIIADIEGREFNGNVDLLKEAVAIYENVIKTIDEQLKSEETKEFSSDEKKSLEDAKKLLETQSKNGRVGTIFEKVEELTEKEMSGTMEKSYNDNKIEELNYSIEAQKENESERLDTFNLIISTTRKNREQVEKLQAIIGEINNLKERRKNLEDKLTKATTEEEKETIKKDIEDVEKDIKMVAAKAKEKADDKSYDLKKDEKIEEYINRVVSQIQTRSTVFEANILTSLGMIENMDVDLGSEKKKVKDYLKEYLDGSKKVYDLSEKLAVDKSILRKNIEKSDEHKEMKKLEAEKDRYERRNEDLEELMDEYRSQNEQNGNSQENSLTEYEEGGWFKRRFNSIKNWFKRKINGKEATNSTKKEERKNVEKFLLKEVEKSVDSRGTRRDFKKQYHVNDKDVISAEVENRMNNKREQYYRSLEDEEIEQ